MAAGLFRKARCFPTVPTFRDASRWCSACLSYPPATPFLQRLKPKATHWCGGFHPFQFLSGTICFEEHSCGSCQAPFQGKRFRWLCSLCLCQTFTFLLTPQDSSVPGGSTGRRAWPLLPGRSYMAQGMEQLRTDRFAWLPLGDPASTFYTDDGMLISNAAQPKGRGFFDSLTMVVIN